MFMDKAIITLLVERNYLLGDKLCAHWPQKPFQLRVACTESEWGNCSRTAKSIVVRWKRGSTTAQSTGSAESEAKNHGEISNFHTFLLYLDYGLLLCSLRWFGSCFAVTTQTQSNLRNDYQAQYCTKARTKCGRSI